MKTEKEIQELIDQTKNGLVQSDSIEDVKYKQGFIRALQFVLSSKRGDAFV